MTISASRYPFANVMPFGRRSEDWINSLSRTLQWNSRQRQKAFHEWDDGGKQDSDQDKRMATVNDNIVKKGADDSSV